MEGTSAAGFAFWNGFYSSWLRLPFPGREICMDIRDRHSWITKVVSSVIDCPAIMEMRRVLAHGSRAAVLGRSMWCNSCWPLIPRPGKSSRHQYIFAMGALRGPPDPLSLGLGRWSAHSLRAVQRHAMGRYTYARLLLRPLYAIDSS